MSQEKTISGSDLDKFFLVEAYGVKVRVESNLSDLLTDARLVVEKAYGDRFKFLENFDGKTDLSFGIAFDGITHHYFQNFERMGSMDVRVDILGYFEGRLRIGIAESTLTSVFIHAGVVEWKGKALVIPGHSRTGKTTLVAELVRNGATYYSDEYAVLDENGWCHPFPRDLAMRGIEGEHIQTDIAVEQLGGRAGTKPISVGWILITEFEADAVWDPQFLTIGQGLLAIIPHAISIGANTTFALGALKKMADNAIIAKSLRNDANIFARTLLSYIDKDIFLDKIA